MQQRFFDRFLFIRLHNLGKCNQLVSKCIRIKKEARLAVAQTCHAVQSAPLPQSLILNIAVDCHVAVVININASCANLLAAWASNVEVKKNQHEARLNEPTMKFD